MRSEHAVEVVIYYSITGHVAHFISASAGSADVYVWTALMVQGIGKCDSETRVAPSQTSLADSSTALWRRSEPDAAIEHDKLAGWSQPVLAAM